MAATTRKITSAMQEPKAIQTQWHRAAALINYSYFAH